MFNGEMIINLENETIIDSHVTVSEVKHNLHISQDETDDDSFIADKIMAAAKDAQEYCDHYFSLTELEYLGFNFDVESIYKIRTSPFQNLVSFETSVDNSTWVDITSDVFIEKRKSDFTLHFEDGLEADYVRFTIRVGYDVDKLPDNAKDAIIVKASDKFDTERSGYASKIESIKAYENSLAPFYNARWT